jgi:mono/diheme cytochrome c family protein
LASNPLFEKNCAKCHGKTADGRHFAGPSLKTEKVAGTSNGDLRAIIANGRGHMPKFGDKLTSDEIATLAEQIKALK